MTVAEQPRDAATAAFDRPGEYDEMLGRGISLSGEDRQFFIDGRLADMRRCLPKGFTPQRVLDFGCGTGNTTAALKRLFPAASVVGVDTSATTVAAARRVHGSVAFDVVEALPALEPFDLCYVNGVFHHIAPEDRTQAARQIRDALTPGGVFAMFENNPWNPGTRMVMKRIPFDADAVPLNVMEARRVCLDAGFQSCSSGRFLFYFPHPLRALRTLERYLVRVPLGAQYWVMATK